MEFEEFLALCARFLVEEDAEAMQEELREAFRLYDKEGNGYIKTSDLREILRALDDKLTEDELDEMIAEIDTDGSGTVDFDGESCTRNFFVPHKKPIFEKEVRNNSDFIFDYHTEFMEMMTGD